jgi:low affinity Fe/Cu permease
MSWVFLITLIALGLIAAAGKVGELIPASKKLTDFLRDSSGWVGLVAIFLGLWWVVRLFWYIGPMLKYAFLTWLIAMACSLVMLALGLVFAKGQLNDWTKSNEKVNGPLQKVWGILEPKQEMLGLIALILALVYLGRII